MKKVIMAASGDKIEIETDGELWSFRAKDIIADRNPGHTWYEKRIIVEGFQFQGKKLWGRIEGEKTCMFTDTSYGLSLLERPR